MARAGRGTSAMASVVARVRGAMIVLGVPLALAACQRPEPLCAPVTDCTVPICNLQSLALDRDGTVLHAAVRGTEPGTVVRLGVGERRGKLLENDTGWDWVTVTPSPNGERLLLTALKRGRTQIATVALDGRGFRPLTDLDGLNWFPALTTDGRRLIFVHADPVKVGRRWARGRLHRLDLATGAVMPIGTWRDESVRDVQTTTDGSIIFSSFSTDLLAEEPTPNDIRDRVYRIRPDGTLEVLATVVAPGVMWPRVSSDGRRLAFMAVINDMDGPQGGFRHDLFVRDDGKLRRITRLRVFTRDMTLSGDGRTAVILAQRAPRDPIYTLYKVDVDTGVVTTLVTDP